MERVGCSRRAWAAAVLGRTLPDHQTLGLEPSQDPAEIAGVEAERPPKLSDSDLVGLGGLEQDPGLGQGVGRPDQALVEQPEHPGVEAVERAHRIDALRSCDGHRPSLQMLD